MCLPRISIITVSYNAVKSIESTILSVINQTYSNIEYIIIDGGSTDGTVDIIKKYADKIAYWVSEPDKGIYDAMNKSLDVASGNWILFLGSDDVLRHETIIEAVITKFIYPDSIYYGNVILKSSQKIYPGIIKSAYQLCLKNFCHQAVFYPLSVYKIHKYNTEYKLWADYVYNLELYGQDPRRFIYVNNIIAIFNNKGRGSLNIDTLFIKNRLQLIENIFGKKMKWIMRFRYKLSELIHGI